MKFRKKPVVIEATHWDGNQRKIEAFCGRNWARADAVDESGPGDDENIVVWNTKESQWLNVPLGHWIIRGVEGELYPCDPDVFVKTYEPYKEKPDGRN